MDDEEEVSGTLASALEDSASGTTPEAQGYAKRFLDRSLSGEARKQSDAAEAALEAAAETNRQALREARARLMSMYQPDPRRMHLDRAAALLAPTRSGHFSEALGRAAESMVSTRDRDLEMAKARDSGILSLDQALAGVDTSVAQSRSSLARARETLEAKMAEKALSTLGKGTTGNGLKPGTMDTISKELLAEGYQWGSPEFQREHQRRVQFKEANQFRVVDVGGVPTIVRGAVPGGAVGSSGPLSSTEREATGLGAIAQGKSIGEARAAAEVSLPSIENKTQVALSQIEELAKHPGLKYVTGAYSIAPIIPGTDQADADARIKTLAGQSFLAAFEALKGAGAVSDAEGKKATEALGRINSRGVKLKDYQQALSDLANVMSRALEVARKKSGLPMAPSAPPPSSSTPQSPSAPQTQKRSLQDMYNQYGAQNANSG